MVVDRFDAVNTKQRFLGHLFFVVRVNDTAYDHSPRFRYNRYVRACEVRADVGGRTNSFFERGFTKLHDGVLERVFDGEGEGRNTQ